MPKSSKRTITALLVLIVVGGVFLLKSTLFHSESIESRLVKARSKGNPSSQIKIVEYIDLQCPACAFGSKILKTVMEKFPEKVHLQMHFFPLPMHKHAIAASIFAECAAAQDKYWPFQDAVLEEQAKWEGLENIRPYFLEIANRVGVDELKLDQCLHDPQTEQRITADKDEGTKRGVKSTPTYFINDEMVVGGRSLIDKLSELLGPISL